MSPRGSIYLLSMAKAKAFLSGRNYVLTSDIHNVIFETVEHRILLNPRAKLNNITEKAVICNILNAIPVPKV